MGPKENNASHITRTLTTSISRAEPKKSYEIKPKSFQRKTNSVDTAKSHHDLLTKHVKLRKKCTPVFVFNLSSLMFAAVLLSREFVDLDEVDDDVNSLEK